MKERKPVVTMTAGEFNALLDELGHDGLRRVMHFIQGAAPLVIDAAMAFEDQLRAAAPRLMWCAARHERDGETFYCELITGHASAHVSPGQDEGDPDVTWTDKALVIAGDFGATIIDGGPS